MIAKTLARSICRELVQVAFMVVTQLQGSASGTFRLRWSAASARFSLVRCRTAPECAFPSRRGAQEVWGNPPARLRGTMENASTGQMRSSNPPPGCGAGCARVRRSRFELDLTEKRILPHRRASECAFPSRRDRRLRFSVECTFPHLGKRRAASRKGALCVCWRTPKGSRPCLPSLRSE